MRFFAPLFAAFAAVAIAQSSSGTATAASSAASASATSGVSGSPNAFNIPLGGLQVSAGVPITLTWTNPSSGTKNIYLTQGGAVVAGSGILLASNIPASATSISVTVPANVNFSQYNFEIVDNSNSSIYNFSGPFTVQGATGASSSGASSMSSSMTGSSSSTGTASSTGSSASSSASSASRSASSSASAASSSASSASRSASSAASSASMSATAAPASNGVTFQVSGLLAMIAAGAALF